MTFRQELDCSQESNLVNSFLIQSWQVIRIFFVAKRKQYKKSPAKPISRSSAKRNRLPFVGDQILALYHFLGSCCCLGLLSLIASLGLGLTAMTANKKEVLKHIQDKQATEFLNKLTPEQGMILFAAAACLFIFAIMYIRAIWQGRKCHYWRGRFSRHRRA